MNSLELSDAEAILGTVKATVATLAEKQAAIQAAIATTNAELEQGRTDLETAKRRLSHSEATAALNGTASSKPAISAVQTVRDRLDVLEARLEGLKAGLVEGAEELLALEPRAQWALRIVSANWMETFASEQRAAAVAYLQVVRRGMDVANALGKRLHSAESIAFQLIGGDLLGIDSPVITSGSDPVAAEQRDWAIANSTAVKALERICDTIRPEARQFARSEVSVSGCDGLISN